MVDRHVQENAGQGNTEKDPKDWVTGDEPMTGAQRSYLSTLCEEAKVAFDESLTKAEASQRIDELQGLTGRGQPRSASAPADREGDDDGQADRSAASARDAGPDTRGNG